MIFDVDVYTMTILTSITCSLLGVFLILNRMSMLIDAIGHSVLLGIVLSFLVVRDLSSPFLMVGATILGIFSSYLSKFLLKNKKIKEDAAIGIVFSFLFSIAIIIISTKLRNIHLDMDTVFLGDVVMINDKKIYTMLFAFFLNLCFLLLFYKELKIVSFDRMLSFALLIHPFVIDYLLMTLISFTTVASFDVFGPVMVIALIIGPSVISLVLNKKKLSHSILVSVLIAFLSSHVGYCLAVLTNLPISGLVVSIILFLFLIMIFFEPNKGIISKIIFYNLQKKKFGVINLLIHIQNNQNQNKKTYHDEVYKHLKWSKKFYKKCLKIILDNKYLKIQNKELILTYYGIQFLSLKNQEFGL